MSNIFEPEKNRFMLKGSYALKGYDLWRHTFTGTNTITGEQTSFFIEYFTCNPYYTQKIPVIGQHSFNKKHGYLPSYMLVKAGWFGKDGTQIHKFYAWKDTFVNENENLNLFTSDCLCSDTKIQGEVKLSKTDSLVNPQYMCDYGEISWDLNIEKQYSASNDNFLSKFNSFDTQWYISGLKTTYDGFIIKNGVKYTVEPKSCNGYCDKNWGKDFPNPWICLTSNKLTSKATGKQLTNSAVSIVGSPPKVCGYPTTHKIFSHIMYEDKYYGFNFLKAFNRDKTKYKVTETVNELFWNVKQESSKAIFEARLKCCKSDMILMNYESPDGNKLHNNLWCGGNAYGILYLWKKKSIGKELIDKIVVEDAFCQYGICDKN